MSNILWRERQLLELLLYKLEVEQILLINGRTRWLSAAAREIEDLLEARIDGVVAKREQLKGKPAPDTYLAGARALDVTPDAAAVFEDALAGVEAARRGAFACVVGVDRVGQAEALREHGATIVVRDLAELIEDR